MKRKYTILILILVIVTLLIFSLIFISAKKKELDLKSYTKSNEAINDKSQEENNVNDDQMISSTSKVSSELTLENVEASKEHEGYQKTTDEEKNKYQIKETTLKKDDKITTVTGTIINNNGSEDIIIRVEFYENNSIKGAASINYNIKIGESKNFEIKTLNNVSTENYKVFVEYVK